MSELSLKQMNDVVQDYCDGHNCFGTHNCDIEDICNRCFGGFGDEDAYDETKEAYERITSSEDKPNEDKPKEDVINHPSHYTHGGMECFEEMELIFGKEALEHFCLLNAWKYRKRALYKNGKEDMEKSDFYLKKYKELKYGTEADIR